MLCHPVGVNHVGICSCVHSGSREEQCGGKPKDYFHTRNFY